MNSNSNNDVLKASFSFSGFKVQSFSFNDSENNSNKLGIKFDPKGIYDEATGDFKLILKFSATDEERKLNVIDTEIIANFKFSTALKLSELPPYFYKNSIAIVFPYLRSFISSLTVQTNTSMLILPLLNLTSLEKPFKDNTVVKQAS